MKKKGKKKKKKEKKNKKKKDRIELEDSRSKNAAQDKQQRETTFYSTLTNSAKRRARERLKLPSNNEHGKALKKEKKEKALVKRMCKKLCGHGC